MIRGRNWGDLFYFLVIIIKYCRKCDEGTYEKVNEVQWLLRQNQEKTKEEVNICSAEEKEMMSQL